MPVSVYSALDDGKIAPHIYTLAMSYFSDGRNLASMLGDGAAQLDLFLSRDDRHFYSVARLMINGKDVDTAACASFQVKPYLSRDGESDAKAAVFACARAFALAAGKVLNLKPQWGILSGVRPVKWLLNCLEAGLEPTEAARVLTQDMMLDPQKTELCARVALKQKKIIETLEERDVGLYISIPFCPTRCSYCSFISTKAA